MDCNSAYRLHKYRYRLCRRVKDCGRFLLKISIFLFLIAMLFSGLPAVQAKGDGNKGDKGDKVNSDTRHLILTSDTQFDPKDWLHPSEFAFLEEETSGRKIIKLPPERSVRLIDKDSLLWVRFKKEILERGVNFAEMRRKWQEIVQSPKYQSANESERISIEENFLVEAIGYQISVSARFYPKDSKEKESEPFALEVEGYSSIKAVNIGGKGKTTREIIVNRRLYRVDMRMGELVLEDEISEGSVELPRRLDEGDQAEVTITNHAIDRPRSWTWRLEVRDMGVHLKQDNTLLLVKRLGSPGSINSSGGEDKIDKKSGPKQAGEEKELESDFKPAAGVSFLFKYTARSRILNSIDPGIGVNASFVDFRKDKDLELGVGPVLSLFDRAFHFNLGWNLMVDSKHFYWSIGIGFLGVSDKVKEAKGLLKGDRK